MNELELHVAHEVMSDRLSLQVQLRNLSGQPIFTQNAFCAETGFNDNRSEETPSPAAAQALFLRDSRLILLQGTRAGGPNPEYRICKPYYFLLRGGATSRYAIDLRLPLTEWTAPSRGPSESNSQSEMIASALFALDFVVGGHPADELDGAPGVFTYVEGGVWSTALAVLRFGESLSGRALGGHLASDALYIARGTHRRLAYGRTLEPPYDRIDEMHFPGQVLP